MTTVQQKLSKVNPIDIILAVIALFGIGFFWYLEKNVLFQTAIVALLVFAGFRIKRGDNSPVLYVVGFIVSTVLFNLSESQKIIHTGVTASLVFALVIFLFYYRHARTHHQHSIAKIFSVYNILLGLLVAEVFTVLVFFLIDPKNKAIIIILFLWLFDETVELYESDNLAQKTASVIIAIFALLLIVILLTSPFENF